MPLLFFTSLREMPMPPHFSDLEVCLLVLPEHFHVCMLFLFDWFVLFCYTSYNAPTDGSSTAISSWKSTHTHAVPFLAAVHHAMLLPQAPLELLLGPAWSNSCQLGPGSAPGCSLPHLLGFCKLLTWNYTPNPTAAAAAAAGVPLLYSYGYAYGAFAGYSCTSVLFTSGALADLILWVLLRLQCKLFRSNVYTKVVACIAAEAKATAAKLQQRRRRWYDKQARTALATSRLRTARTLRISKLKASMLEDAGGQLVYRGSSGSNTAVAATAGAQEALEVAAVKDKRQQQPQPQAAPAAAGAADAGQGAAAWLCDTVEEGDFHGTTASLQPVVTRRTSSGSWEELDAAAAREDDDDDAASAGSYIQPHPQSSAQQQQQLGQRSLSDGRQPPSIISGAAASNVPASSSSRNIGREGYGSPAASASAALYGTPPRHTHQRYHQQQQQDDSSNQLGRSYDSSKDAGAGGALREAGFAGGSSSRRAAAGRRPPAAPAAASGQQQPLSDVYRRYLSASVDVAAPLGGRHARSSSDPDMGLRWSCQPDLQQQLRQQHRQPGDISSSTLNKAAAQQCWGGTAGTATGGTTAEVREYVLPDPRLQLLLTPAASTDGSSRGHSRSVSLAEGTFYHTAAAGVGQQAGEAGPNSAMQQHSGSTMAAAAGQRRAGSCLSGLAAAVQPGQAVPQTAPPEQASFPELKYLDNAEGIGNGALPQHAPGGGEPSQGLSGLVAWLRRKTSALMSGSSGWEAGLCYVLFIAGFALDYSVCSMVYLVSMLLVPLLAQGKAKTYWTVMLVYTEVRWLV